MARRHGYIYETDDGYLVRSMTHLQAFFYDWRHYGLGVALHNARVLLWGTRGR